MRRGHVLLLVLIWSATTASAQAPPPLPPQLPARLEQLLFINGVQPADTSTNVTVEQVIARMLSFDRDDDGRVTESELPERMLAILPRGDIDRDGALDLTEIRALSARPAELTVRGFPQLRGGGYGFADEGSVSSLPHIQGALEDLRLASDRRDQALPIVTAFGQALDADASMELLNALRPLLTAEQLADVNRALNVSDPGRFIISRESQGKKVFMVGSNLSRLVEAYGLEAAQKDQALAAVRRYKERLRPADQDRAALLDQMAGILTDEERDDFRAALERRPVVKSGPGGAVAGAGFGRMTVPPSSIINVDGPRVRPAVLIDHVGP